MARTSSPSPQSTQATPIQFERTPSNFTVHPTSPVPSMGSSALPDPRSEAPPSVYGNNQYNVSPMGSSALPDPSALQSISLGPPVVHRSPTPQQNPHMSRTTSYLGAPLSSSVTSPTQQYPHISRTTSNIGAPVLRLNAVPSQHNAGDPDLMAHMSPVPSMGSPIANSAYATPNSGPVYNTPHTGANIQMNTTSSQLTSVTPQSSDANTPIANVPLANAPLASVTPLGEGQIANDHTIPEVPRAPTSTSSTSVTGASTEGARTPTSAAASRPTATTPGGSWYSPWG